MDWHGAAMTPLAGGYSGETFLVGDPGDEVVLRIYARAPARLLVDAALLRLVRGIVAVPEVLEVRPATGDEPAVLVTSRLPGIPLDRVLSDPPGHLDVGDLGSSVGGVLAALACIPMLRSGRLEGPDLTVVDHGVAGDLTAWAEFFRDTGRLAGWDDRDWQALLRLLDGAQRRLDESAGDIDQRRAVLVHGDLNPKNILVDPESATVTGVLDWEFAHAGSVFTDLGNLTRFERDDRFVGPLVERFVAGAPGHLDDALGRGRLLDLWSLVELAGRPGVNAVQRLAEELLLAQARHGDVSRWPWRTARVDPARAEHVS